jgi:hypothetical protein
VPVQSTYRKILGGLAAGGLLQVKWCYVELVFCAALALGVAWPDMHSLAYREILGGLAAGGLLQVRCCWSALCSALLCVYTHVYVRASICKHWSRMHAVAGMKALKLTGDCRCRFIVCGALLFRGFLVSCACAKAPAGSS